MNCPRCDSEQIVKNGSIHNGKQKFKCTDCGRQFVENPKNKPITQEVKQYIDKLLLERRTLSGICRVMPVSSPWLINYAKKKYQHGDKTLQIIEKPKGKGGGQ